MEATRFLLTGFKDDQGLTLTLQWHNRTLWRGSLPADTTGTQIMNLLGYAFTPLCLGAVPQLYVDDLKWSNQTIQAMTDASEPVCTIVFHASDSTSMPEATLPAATDSRVQVLVKTLQGSTLVMQIHPSETGHSMKKKIEQQTHVPAHQQRLVHQGKPIHDEATMGDCQVQRDSIIHVTAGLPGGGKDINRAQAKNSIATTLLERGHDIAWVSQTAEELMRKVGLKDAIAIAQLPGGTSRTKQVLDMCHQCNIEVPAPQRKQALKFATHVEGQKQRRLQPVPPAPEQYTIEPGYLLNADGTPTAQIQQISALHTGVCILSVKPNLGSVKTHWLPKTSLQHS